MEKAYSSILQPLFWGPLVDHFEAKFFELSCRHSADPTGSMTKVGANGSSVYFLGRFYDNVFVRRKGVTSLSWPKPKLKFELLEKVRDPCSSSRGASALGSKTCRVSLVFGVLGVSIGPC